MQIFEAIILRKIPFKEKDLVLQVLMRTGLKASVLIYGGQGGGKSYKAKNLELGNLVEFTLSSFNKGIQSDILTAKSFQLSFAHRFIREDYLAYTLLCFELELINKISLKADEVGQSHYQEGLFNVLSNSIFYLDQLVEQKKQNHLDLLILFLTKLIYQLGVFPELSNCSACQAELVNRYYFNLDGGFLCADCTMPEDQSRSSLNLAHQLRSLVQIAATTQFKSYTDITNKLEKINPQVVERLFSYLCYQLHLKQTDILSFNGLQQFLFKVSS
jgi:DNA repair protein RecO